MSFSYDRKLMAQALSVVGEAGIHGMEYNGLEERWADLPNSRQSDRARVSLVSAHKFTGEEFETYMILAWRFRFVERSKYREIEWVHGAEKSSYDIDDEIVRLTREGWEFIAQNDRPLLHRWAANIAENIPTVVISVLAALAVSWAVYVWGAPASNSRSPDDTTSSPQIPPAS